MRANDLKLVCISDTHGDHEKLELPPGDVLIHAGDLTGRGTIDETQAFFRWFGLQDFTHKICIAGNHDTYMEVNPIACRELAKNAGVVLLEDSGCVIEGVSIWGSPITPRFLDWSFMRDPGEDIEAHWALIPIDTDVLITHGPAYGILDEIDHGGFRPEHTGCPSLLKKIEEVQPKYHVFGHIHEGFGRIDIGNVSHCNVSTMNKQYDIYNCPVVIQLDKNHY